MHTSKRNSNRKWAVWNRATHCNTVLESETLMPARIRTRKKAAPKRRPELVPTPPAAPGALKPCITCGGLIRWALRSCFNCNRVLLGYANPARGIIRPFWRTFE
jgi:hypothetical protein